LWKCFFERTDAIFCSCSPSVEGRSGYVKYNIAKRFEEEVEKRRKAGLLDPDAADAALDELVRKSVPKRNGKT